MILFVHLTGGPSAGQARVPGAEFRRPLVGEAAVQPQRTIAPSWSLGEERVVGMRVPGPSNVFDVVVQPI